MRQLPELATDLPKTLTSINKLALSPASDYGGNTQFNRDLERLLAQLTNDWWGEPLGAMLSRGLVAELGQRLPQSTVIGESGAVSASPDATIALNVQRLDEDASGQLVLQAQAGVSFRGRGAPALQGFRFTVPPPVSGVAREVAAISTAVGKLADGFAGMALAGGGRR
jgi:uncharacterized lipoprotein YmbA